MKTKWTFSLNHKGHRNVLSPIEIMNFVIQKKRDTEVNHSTQLSRQFIQTNDFETVFWQEIVTPHYSWDWNGIHFVHLNLYPGDGGGIIGKTPYKQDICNNPLNSLSFLKADLEKHVGNKSTPVILIHHFGFDNYSVNDSINNLHKKGWWTEQERVAYWDAIAKYNIAAIVTGHNHTPEPYHLVWKKPMDAKYPNRFYNDNINTFAVGAMRGANSYCEFSVANGQLVVRRFGKVISPLVSVPIKEWPTVY